MFKHQVIWKQIYNRALFASHIDYLWSKHLLVIFYTILVITSIFGDFDSRKHLLSRRAYLSKRFATFSLHLNVLLRFNVFFFKKKIRSFFCARMNFLLLFGTRNDFKSINFVCKNNNIKAGTCLQEDIFIIAFYARFSSLISFSGNRRRFSIKSHFQTERYKMK